jgi:hypothetical protein
MSPRKTILRELSRAHKQAAEGDAHRRPAAITGYGANPERFQKAVNDLLQARLLEGRKDADGHMTIALNAHRMREVERELRPIWARPAVWLAVALVLAIGAGLAV